MVLMEEHHIQTGRHARNQDLCTWIEPLMHRSLAGIIFHLDKTLTALTGIRIHSVKCLSCQRLCHIDEWRPFVNFTS